ncbi:hypothetical protein HY639_01705 [Candidatus Woesearchaeota archaeon]|nr:hypothetical protein [Candidatus Woesearchaeota archaeon]
MGRSGKPASSCATLEAQKLNRSCPHYRNGACVRQQRMCNNKDPFYEACIVFKGNNTLGFFMKQRKYFQPNVPVYEEQKAEVPQEVTISEHQ